MFLNPSEKIFVIHLMLKLNCILQSENIYNDYGQPFWPLI